MRRGHVISAPLAWLGRRGFVLVTFGVCWILIGLTLPNVIEVPPERSLQVHLLTPLPISVALWCIAGVGAILGATISRPRWQDLGFFCLGVMPGWRAISFAFSYCAHLGTGVARWFGYDGPGYGDPVAYSGFIFWFVVIVAVLAIAAEDAEPGREARVATEARS